MRCEIALSGRADGMWGTWWLQAGSTLEELLSELAAAGIVCVPASRPLADYHGDVHLVPKKGSEAEPAPPSPADVRRAVTATCILPLAAAPAARAK